MVFQDDSNFCWKDASNPILCAFSHILAPNIEMLYYTNHGQIQLKNAAGDVVYTTLSMWNYNDLDCNSKYFSNELYRGNTR